MPSHRISLILASVGFLEVVCHGKYPCFVFLVLHLIVLRYRLDPSIILLSGIGFLEDLYSPHLFGLTSFYLIFMMLSLKTLIPWIQKLDNFWLIWLSYGLFMLLYMGIESALVYIMGGTAILHIKDLMTPLMLITSYPLLFKLVKPFTPHVRS